MLTLLYFFITADDIQIKECKIFTNKIITDTLYFIQKLCSWKSKIEMLGFTFYVQFKCWMKWILLYRFAQALWSAGLRIRVDFLSIRTVRKIIIHSKNSPQEPTSPPHSKKYKIQILTSIKKMSENEKPQIFDVLLTLLYLDL